MELGQPRQIGYVVPDVQAGMRHWIDKLGVGPWFYKEDIGLTDYTYYGRRTETPPKVSIALANSGDVQIELIQPKDDVPTLWSDSLTQAAGPQHVAYWVENFDEVCAELLHRGMIEGHAGQSGNRGRWAYFVDAQAPGAIVEISEYIGSKAAYFTSIAEAAQDWDGSDPIRLQPSVETPGQVP